MGFMGLSVPLQICVAHSVVLLYCFCPVKTALSMPRDNSAIIYPPSCRSKPVRLYTVNSPE